MTDFKNYTIIRLGELRRTAKNVRIVGAPAGIRNIHLWIQVRNVTARATMPDENSFYSEFWNNFEIYSCL